MSVSQKAKWQVFILLITVLSVSVLLNFRPQSKSVIATTKAPLTKSAGSNSADPYPGLALLGEKPPASLNVQRNIFEFRSEQQPQTTVVSLRNKVQAAAETEQPKLPDVHFLGVYEEKNASHVKLIAINNGGKIYVGGVGDVLAHRYEVLEIGADYIILRLVPENKKIRVRLGKGDDKIEELKEYKELQKHAVAEDGGPEDEG